VYDLSDRQLRRFFKGKHVGLAAIKGCLNGEEVPGTSLAPQLENGDRQAD